MSIDDESAIAWVLENAPPGAQFIYTHGESEQDKRDWREAYKRPKLPKHHRARRRQSR